MLKVNKYLVEQATTSKNPREHYSFFHKKYLLGEIPIDYWEKYYSACLMQIQKE